jgi:hypothetical protein
LGDAGDAGDAERVLSFGAEPTRQGVPVTLVTEADAIESHALAPGEARSARLPIPSGATSVTVTLKLRAIRWEILEALDLGARRPDVPTIEVAAAHLPFE